MAWILVLLTSSVSGFGGGGRSDLLIFLSFALWAPLEDLAFFPIVTKLTDEVDETKTISILNGR